MATVQRRRPTSQIHAKALQFLVARAEEKVAKTRKDLLNKDLSKQIDEFGDLDEVTGHRTFVLKDAVSIGGSTYGGLMRQKRTSPRFDEDVAEGILQKRGLYDEATTTVTTTSLDQDKVYALHQLGKISDEEMDLILTSVVTYALVPISE